VKQSAFHPFRLSLDQIYKGFRTNKGTMKDVIRAWETTTGSRTIALRDQPPTPIGYSWSLFERVDMYLVIRSSMDVIPDSEVADLVGSVDEGVRSATASQNGASTSRRG
jgi:hypothetical protein